MLTARDIEFRYGHAAVLTGATLTVERGEVVALVGASGSGKTTLLYCLAGLVRPASGTVDLDGMDLTSLSEAELAKVRRERFGFVFQSAELVPELSLFHNVALPLELLGVGRRERTSRVESLLGRLGLDELGDRRPDQVSGGQAQRAAVARSLVHRPSVVFADEPTGALDSGNSDVVLQALIELAHDNGSAVVLVTHDDKVAAAADRRVWMHDGRSRDQDGTV